MDPDPAAQVRIEQRSELRCHGRISAVLHGRPAWIGQSQRGLPVGAAGMSEACLWLGSAESGPAHAHICHEKVPHCVKCLRAKRHGKRPKDPVRVQNATGGPQAG